MVLKFTQLKAPLYEVFRMPGGLSAPCRKFLAFVLIMLVSFSKQASAVLKTFGSPPGSSMMSDMYTYSSAYHGTYTYYRYSAGGAVYGKSEIGMPGTITSYAMYKYSGTTSPSLTLDSTYVFMKEVGTTTALSSPFNLDGYTMVFKGTFENSTASGWQTVNLTTPFNYTNTGNLSIIVTTRRASSTGTYQYYWVSYAYGSGYNVA
ncbi:MAG: hypothetical protein JNL13_05315, partial [Chitinophagaceae bacterium]|nr:hypothetical protein [Chitinophagaceae bacterium]